MKINKNFLRPFFVFVIVLSVVFPAFSVAQEPAETITLKQTIENAIKANLGLQASREEIKATEATKKAQLTYFLPTFSATYGYKLREEETGQSLSLIDPFPTLTTVITVPEDEYAFTASITQPLFAGFDLINRYKIASLGLDAAKIEERLVRQDIIFEAKTSTLNC